MKTTMVVPVLAVTLWAGSTARAKETKEQKRDAIQKMATDTLNNLYQIHPALGRMSRSQQDTPFSTTWACTCCW